MATTIGKPLVIDAENWMAHPGSANTLISIFTHTKTPTNFVVLSGDVHYSFAYDIKLRYRRNSPNIYQITCSGIKISSQLRCLNSAMYGTVCCTALAQFWTTSLSVNAWRSKSEALTIKPSIAFNRSAIGELRLDTDGKPQSITTLSGDGKVTRFPEPD